MKFELQPDGTTTYTTSDGDTVDQIAFAYYRTHEGTTPAVYEANPGLAARGLVLPAGVVITMPVIYVAPKPIEQVSLWD